MADLLGVSRSGFYDWARREQAPPTPAQQRRAVLTERIVYFHAQSDHVYGSPRILADLRKDGHVVSGKTVAKLMRRNGIVGISPRKFLPVTTVPGPDPQPLPDLVGRVFDRGELNAVWTSDIT
ncbi:IS3 family transposase [Nakamurella sp. GG22]